MNKLGYMLGRNHQSQVRPQWTNWAGTSSFCPTCIWEPSSLSELRQIVKNLSQKNQQIRTVGTGYSWNDLNSSHGHLISTKKLSNILAITGDLLEVEAGTPLGAVIKAAAEANLTVEGATLNQDISIGGMVATGSHGSGLGQGSISDYITKITIVRPNGDVVTISEDDPLMAAACISLGSLGVIYSVQIRCAKAYRLHTQDIVIPLRHALKEIEYIARSNEHVSVYWIPFTDKLWFYIANRTYDPVDYSEQLRRKNERFDYYISSLFTRVMFATTRNFPYLTPKFLSFAGKRLPNRDFVREWEDAFHYRSIFPKIHDAEFVASIDRSEEIFRHMIGMVYEYQDQRKFPINMVVHARFTAGSSAYLSPTHGRPSICIEAATSTTAHMQEEFYQEMEQKLMDCFDARPHWGKMFSDYPRVGQSYGHKLTQFLQIQRQFDPHGQMLNAALEKIFHVDLLPNLRTLSPFTQDSK